MAFLSYKRASIRGISCCVPSNIVNSVGHSPILSDKETRKIIETTGIKERRFAPDDVCASDLCFAAAESLLSNLRIDRNSIDVLIFLSQTPDYLHVPATSCILQDRLNLSTKTAAFDLALGCSGYVYALSTAFSYIESGANRVLLLAGETLSKFTSAKDRTTALIFGDAGSATLIDSKNEASPGYFSLNSDGRGFESIVIPVGGYRQLASKESLTEKTYEDDSVRNLHHVKMDGMEVLDFTTREVAKDIIQLMDKASLQAEDIDSFIFHQANLFILNLLRKKLKLKEEKIPVSIDRFGNTSTVSIPLTICDAFGKNEEYSSRLLMSGYGAGLSWGSCCINLTNCYIDSIAEMQPV